MADETTVELPEGTDTIIEGASRPDNSGAIAIDRADAADDSGTVTIDSATGQGLSERLRDGSEKLVGQAGDKARGFVGQGLERTAEALANVSRMVGDTAGGIEERLGPEYADYARRAAGAIENVANSLAEKNADELIDDTRSFVRNSPGIALAGAAVVGFVLARLVKTGLGNSEDDEND
ncbi:MAG: hypothetical protein ABIO80_03595 [Sphingomicrobium sp.]